MCVWVPKVAMSLEVRRVSSGADSADSACCHHVAEVTTRTLKRGSPRQGVAKEGQIPSETGERHWAPCLWELKMPEMIRVLVKPLSKDAVNSR